MLYRSTGKNIMYPMIEISDKTAIEVQNLFRHFIAVTKDIPRTNRNDNARRVAGKIIKYIDRKNEEKEIKRDIDAARLECADCGRVGMSSQHGDQRAERSLG